MQFCQSNKVLRGTKFQVTQGGYEFFTQATWESEWFPGCEVRVFDL